MLNKEELKRYNRHLILPEIGKTGQEKLKDSSVLIIGAGGLGCPVAQYLVAAGVGKITLIDDDVVDLSNLQRQILYTPNDVGLAKAEVAAQKLSLQNPHVSIQGIKSRLTTDNVLELFKQHDLIIDGTDNFPTRYLINDAAVITNKPWVFGSLYKFDGQISVFNYQDGPTYRCLFPEAPEEGSVPNCAQIGVIGVLPGLIGCYQANEAIKIITGAGTTLKGKLLHIDALSMQFQTFEFALNPANKNITELKEEVLNCEITVSHELISVDELNDWIEKGKELQLIDVRTLEEFNAAQIEGANHIAFEELANNIENIDRKKTVVLYCHYMDRSKKAATLLNKDYGFSNLFVLEGGINEWALEIDNSIGVY